MIHDVLHVKDIKKKNPHISSYTSYHPEEEKTPETKQQNTKKSHN